MHINNYISGPPVRFPPNRYSEQIKAQQAMQWQDSLRTSASDDTATISEQAKYLSSIEQSPPKLRSEMKPWFYRDALEHNYALAESRAREVVDEASESGLDLDYESILEQIMLSNGIQGPSLEIPNDAPETSNSEITRYAKLVPVQSMINDTEKARFELMHTYATEQKLTTDVVADIARKYAIDKNNLADRGKAPPHLDVSYFDGLLRHMNEWNPAYDSRSGIERLREFFLT